MAQRRSTLRRREIRTAALSCFSDLGFERTTIEDIRQRSQASTGSIYHHYGSKGQLAAAVYMEGISDYQAFVLAPLEGDPDAETGVREVVSAHLRWVEEHPDWARFLFDMRQVPSVAASEPSIRELNKRFLEQMGRWFRCQVRQGHLRRMPKDLYPSVLIGPCMDYTRRWLDGHTQTDIRAAAETLGECVWEAVRAPLPRNQKEA